jgi:hypothetical protein
MPKGSPLYKIVGTESPYKLYCKGKLDYTEKEIFSVNIDKDSFPTEREDIDKKIFKNLGQTRNKIASVFYDPLGTAIQTSDADKVCLGILEVLLGIE